MSAASPAEAAKDAKRKGPRRRVRFWVAMVVGVVALLGLGGVGVAVLLYDKETKIERAEPEAVVDKFLGAYFTTKDDNQVSLYTCEPPPNFTALKAFRSDIEGREKKYSIGIDETWRGFQVQAQGTNATVTVEIVRTISDGSEETSDRWRFDLRDDDGWRVCGAEPVV